MMVVTLLPLVLVSQLSSWPVEGSRLSLGVELPTPGAALSIEELETGIAEYTRRITSLNVNWPAGASLLVATGAITLYVGLLVAVPILGFGATATAGLVLLSIGLGAVALIVVGAVLGISMSNTARETRARLVKERDDLIRTLEQLKAPMPMVRVDDAMPAIRLATF